MTRNFATETLFLSRLVFHLFEALKLWSKMVLERFKY